MKQTLWYCNPENGKIQYCYGAELEAAHLEHHRLHGVLTQNDLKNQREVLAQ